MSDLIERRYLLVKRGLYYGPDNAGYTGVKDRAGRYTQADADFFADDDYVTSILEDEAPMFAPACWNEVKVEHLLAQIATLTAELAEARESERAAVVDWLRFRLKGYTDPWSKAADAIEAREHLTRDADPVRDTLADSDGDDGA